MDKSLQLGEISTEVSVDIVEDKQSPFDIKRSYYHKDCGCCDLLQHILEVILSVEFKTNISNENVEYIKKVYSDGDIKEFEDNELKMILKDLVDLKVEINE